MNYYRGRGKKISELEATLVYTVLHRENLSQKSPLSKEEKYLCPTHIHKQHKWIWRGQAIAPLWLVSSALLWLDCSASTRLLALGISSMLCLCDLAKAARGYVCVIILLSEPSSEILSNSSVWSSPSCAMTQNVPPGRKLGLNGIYSHVQVSLTLCSLLSSISEHPFRPSFLAAYIRNSTMARNMLFYIL